MTPVTSERLPAEREIKVVRPLYSVEVIETETAQFEIEISEEDIHATWKLKGETLHPSAVRAPPSSPPPSSQRRATLPYKPPPPWFLNPSLCVFVFQDVELKQEGTRHVLILFNCKKDMAGSVDFAAANAKSSAQLRVKGDSSNMHCLRWF